MKRKVSLLSIPFSIFSDPTTRHAQPQDHNICHARHSHENLAASVNTHTNVEEEDHLNHTLLDWETIRCSLSRHRHVLIGMSISWFVFDLYLVVLGIS